MSKKLRKCLSLVLAVMLLASISVFGTLNASADYKTGDGLAAYAMTAYNEGWRYVWGGASYGAVDCSGLIYSYVGGGARVTEDMLYSSPESGYVANGVPEIPGLALWQPGHVGVYIGNGMAVDARDEISNVCYSAVSSKSWVMWFKVAGITYGGDTSVANDNQNTEQTDSAAGTDTSASNDVYDVLSIGSQGKEVNRLQERLKELGYFEDNTTDYFGTVTQSALIEFQTTAGLTADGIFTEDVKTALYSDNAPAKLLSSNVNPEETTESGTQEDEEITETENNIIIDDTEDINSESDILSDTENVTDVSDIESSDRDNDSEIEIDDTAENDNETVDEDVIFGVGDEDEEITNLQYILILLGYYDYDLTSTYDDNMAYAVAQYQLDNNLDATGNVDLDTYNALYGSFGSNDSESDTQTDIQNDVSAADDNEENDEVYKDSENENVDLYEGDTEADSVTSEISQEIEDEVSNETVVQEPVSDLDNEDNYEIEPDKSSYVKSYQAADAEVESDNNIEVETAATTSNSTDSTAVVGDTDTVDVNTASDTETSLTAAVSDNGTDNTDSADSTDNIAVQSKAADTQSSPVVVSEVRTSGETAPVDVPKTGVITLYPRTVAAVGIIVSLLIIFFAANIHYWNISMEKRKQRARRAVSVSAYRRSSR